MKISFVFTLNIHLLKKGAILLKNRWIHLTREKSQMGKKRGSYKRCHMVITEIVDCAVCSTTRPVHYRYGTNVLIVVEKLRSTYTGITVS